MGNRPALCIWGGNPWAHGRSGSFPGLCGITESFFPFLNDGTSLQPNGSVLGLPDGSVVKNPLANAEDVDSILGSVRSPGEGNGNPLQYSRLGNLMVRGAWWVQSMGLQGIEQDWACTHGTAQLCISPFPAYRILEVSRPFFILSCLCRPSVQAVSVSAEIVDWIHKPHPNCFLPNVLSHLFCIFCNMDRSVSKKIRQYVLQFSSVTQSCPTLCNPMNRSRPGLPVHHQLPEFTQTHVHRVGDAIQPSHPLSSPSPPALNLSQHQSFFKWVSLRMRWPKYWSFSLSISPSNEHPGLVSFRMDLLDLLAVQGTLKSLLQHHSSKASILRCSAFFTVQLSHPYMTIGKTIALTRRTFVGKVMSLLFNMLSRLVITFLARRKH